MGRQLKKVYGDLYHARDLFQDHSLGLVEFILRQGPILLLGGFRLTFGT
jgi:hypothetical protein